MKLSFRITGELLSSALRQSLAGQTRIGSMQTTAIPNTRNVDRTGLNEKDVQHSSLHKANQ